MNSENAAQVLADKIAKHCAAEGYSEISLRLKWQEWLTIIESLTRLPHGPKDEAVKKLRVALSLCDRYCERLHHEKKHQHKSGEPCPVEKIIHDALDSTDALFATGGSSS